MSPEVLDGGEIVGGVERLDVDSLGGGHHQVVGVTALEFSLRGLSPVRCAHPAILRNRATQHSHVNGV